MDENPQAEESRPAPASKTPVPPPSRTERARELKQQQSRKLNKRRRLKQADDVELLPGDVMPGWSEGAASNFASKGQTKPKGRPKGCHPKNDKVHLTRQQVAQAIMDELGRRDKVQRGKGKDGGFLGTLSTPQFLNLLRAIIPRDIVMHNEAADAVLAALKAKANEDRTQPWYRRMTMPREVGN